MSAIQPPPLPASATEVHQLLLTGNAAYANRRPAASMPAPRPFAAILGCSDARAPLEAIFARGENEVFVVRVAGNVLGAECLGSLDYAIDNLPTVRLVAVVGHTGCGAVSAAVDAFLTPAGFLDVAANRPLHAIIAPLLLPVREAADALRRVRGDDAAARPGYRAALVDMAVVLNAALVAATLRRAYPAPLGIVYGVYDLATDVVGGPDAGGDGWRAGLFEPPADAAAYDALALTLAGSVRLDGD